MNDIDERPHHLFTLHGEILPLCDEHYDQVDEVLSGAGLKGAHRILGDCLVYRENDLVVGCAAHGRLEGSRRGWLNCVAVRKSHRHRGIGSALVRRHIEALPRNHEIWLETLFWNRRFYEGLGFEFIRIDEAKKLFETLPRQNRNTMIMRFSH